MLAISIVQLAVNKTRPTLRQAQGNAPPEIYQMRYMLITRYNVVNQIS